MSTRVTSRRVRVVLSTALAALLPVFLATTVHAQERVVTGRVTAAGTGQALAGVQVYSGGPDATTDEAFATAVTSADGRYSVRAPAGAAVLTFQSIGYREQRVDVGASQQVVDVQLNADVLRLSEVVVTGQATGIQRRNLANAVSTVSADELVNVPAASLETQLAGKVAGADIQSNSGAPGGGNQINLRGVSTIIGASTPLYVIDGVIVSDNTIQSGANSITEAGGGIAGSQDNAPNRIADINPADIQTVEVLKGASAAAIYGSKASNGVIVITTKRGQAGETRFHLGQRVGFSQISNKMETRTFTDSATAIDVFGAAARPFFQNGVPVAHDNIEALAGGTAPAYETIVDVSGGTEKTRFMISGLARNDEGIVTGTYYEKYSLRVNLDQMLRDNLTLSLSTNALRSKTGRGFTNNDNSGTSYFVAFTGTPSFVDLAQNADGTFPVNPFQNSNPLQTAALAKNDESVSRFFGAAQLKWDAWQSGAHSLRVNGTAGVDYFAQKNVVYAPEDLQFEVLVDGIPGTSVLSTGDNTQANLGVNAVYELKPTDANWTSTTSAGVQYEYFSQDIARWLTEDLFPGQSNIDQGVLFQPSQSRALSKDLGVFAQEELLWDERLLLTAGVRLDRSSDNALIDDWYAYPKAAASYLITPGISGIDEVKFRAAWGQAGNQPLYGQKFNVLNAGAIVGLQTLQLGNTTVAADLRPERQSEIEGGIDVVLFDGRGSVELTGYHRRIDDLLLTRALPPSSGFSNAIYNMDGWMTTRGIEAALTAVPVQGAFTWTSRTTFSRDRSVIDSLDVAPFNAPSAGFGTSLGAVRIEQGKSPTQIVGRDTVAVLDDPRCLEALATEAGSGVCTPGTRFITKLGDANPDFRMGFVNTFQYRSVSLTSLIDWQSGGDVINLTGYLLDANRNAADFDDPCNLEGCQPGQTLGEYRLSVYPGRTSKVWIEDGSFVKVRELALNWDVPSSLFQRVLSGVDGLRLSVSGRNLFTFTDYTGVDPEVNNFGSQAIRANVDVAPYPPSRSFWFTADVTF